MLDKKFKALKDLRLSNQKVLFKSGFAVPIVEYTVSTNKLDILLNMSIKPDQ